MANFSLKMQAYCATHNFFLVLALLTVLVTQVTWAQNSTSVLSPSQSANESVVNVTSDKSEDTNSISSVIESPIPNENRNGSRDGRGILDTFQTLIQTAQTVNKLFGNLGSGSLNNNNNNNNYQRPQQNAYPGQSQGGNNYYQGNGNYPNPNPNYQGAPSNNYNTPTNDYYGSPPIITAQNQAPIQSSSHAQPQYQDPGQVYTQSSSQVHPNYQSFPVSSSLSFQNNNNNNNNNNKYPGSVASVPLDTDVYNNIPLNKQGQGFPIGGGAGGGLGNLNGIGTGGLGGALPGGIGGNLLSSLGELGVVEDISELLSFGNVEKVLTNVNKFDSLQCIPRLVCQTIARRQQEAADRERERERTSTTSTTTTRRPKSSKGRKNKNDRDRSARFIPGLKIQGVDTALEQVVKFLDLMQLKDWSLYPYLSGAYHGNQVKSWDECAEKFSTCPFSEDQLLYYFNNYKGGLFQSFRSDLHQTPPS